MTKAIIIGSNGQDGRCLSDLLLQRGYEVIGVSRESYVDIYNEESVATLIKSEKPDEIYFLAAYHHSSEQKNISEIKLWDQSIKTHLMAPSILLECVRLYHPCARVFYASSSLIFGASNGVLNESSPILPDSPYGITKSAGMSLCQYYRDTYNTYVSIGILFNHESEYRASKFLSKKVAIAISEIQKGKRERLQIGSLSAQVDWGYARNYVEAMTRINRLEKPENFVISSGKLHSVKEFLEIAFEMAGLDAYNYVEENRLILQRSIPSKLGDYSKLKKMTGWSPTVSFEKLVEILLKSEEVKIINKYE